MEKRNKKSQKKTAPKRLSKKQLQKLQGGWGRCSNVWCCSLGSAVPGGCTSSTAIPKL